MDLKDIEEFRALFGKRAEKSLSVLGELFSEFEKIYGTDIGKEILKDDVDRYNILADKAIKGDLPIEERAEINYLQSRIGPIVSKLDKYFELLNKIETNRS